MENFGSWKTLLLEKLFIPEEVNETKKIKLHPFDEKIKLFGYRKKWKL